MKELDWSIRPCADSDHQDVRVLLERSFDGPAEADLVEKLRRDGAMIIELLAWTNADQDAEGSGIAGYIALSAMASPARSLGLGPVATDDRFRKNGIAASLIESGLALAAAQDFTGVFVLGDQTYYERFGFDARAAQKFSSPYSGPDFAVAILDEDHAPQKGEASYASAFSSVG